MGSTALITYLNYLSTWETESDANIDSLISEQTLFVNLGDFDSDSVVNREFSTIHDLACEVRDYTIAADAIQITADAAAVASIWSFGLGMAAFVVLEGIELLDKQVISSKSKELNKKLTTVDTDISSQINDNVNNYVVKYKANNNLIVSKAPKGLDNRTCRAILMQFMAQVQIIKKNLDATNFRIMVESARKAYESEEINKVYDALDKLNLSAKSDADVKKFMNVLVGLNFPEAATYTLLFIRGISIAIMIRKLGIANNTIKEAAIDAGIPVEEVDASVFGAMDAVGKFATVVAVITSVVDVVLNIIDIVDVVKQCKKMCDKLDTTIKESYKLYFNSIKTASQKYKAAISAHSENSLLGNYECHKYDKGGKNNWHYVTITKIEENTFKWTNRAGVSWTLKLTSDKTILDVGKECPYYYFNYGKQKGQPDYTQATVIRDGDRISGIIGPGSDALYTKSV